MKFDSETSIVIAFQLTVTAESQESVSGIHLASGGIFIGIRNFFVDPNAPFGLL